MHAHDTHTTAAVRACVRAYVRACVCQINFFLMGVGVLVTSLDVDLAEANSSIDYSKMFKKRQQ